jgi:hypothetical protein
MKQSYDNEIQMDLIKKMQSNALKLVSGSVKIAPVTPTIYTNA